MKTSKPFSTISYNSADFLNQKLGDLVQRRLIDFYAWIFHYPEEDELKEHKHLLIIPNGRVDTDQVLDYLLEIDPTHPDKPLKCMRPRSSKFADWYLYSIHDTAYLASIGQTRKYHYKKEDVQNCDNDYLTEMIHTIDYTKLNRLNSLRDAALTGVPFEELIIRGVIPVQQVYAFQHAYELMGSYGTNRGDKEGHQKIDPETGEILTDN